MKTMLINATQSEELRVAIVETDRHHLLDLIIERQNYKNKTGNIYLGIVTSVEPSLDAAFVYFGSERHGFLPLKEIASEYHHNPPAGDRPDRVNVRDALKEGQVIMVQVEKEERGTKGAALTTYISLAGSYLVLMPNNPKAGGISRRVEGDEREELRENLTNLQIPENMGTIVRTAGVGRTLAELQWDLNILLKQWEAINRASTDRAVPFLIHQESDVVIRAIRDYLRQDISEIVIDNPTAFEKAKNYIEQIRPDFAHRLKLYTGSIPLFSHYQVEHQIELAHQRDVRLPSGGSIVIDHTEALVAVDINSARATKGSDIEETALNTNLEAADEVARQLRIRDIGGLIVIDFIDMASIRHQREVENHLRNSLKLDRARIQVGRISRFGLLEMSRQRLRPSLGETTQVICPRCNGWGTIRGVESLALAILRIIEEDATKAGSHQLQVQLPIDIATFMINEKREAISLIEKAHDVIVTVVPNPELQSPRYKIKRLSEDESSSSGQRKPSYRLLETPEFEQVTGKKMPTEKPIEKPAVKNIFNGDTTTTTPKKPTPPSLIKRLWSSMFGGTSEHEEKIEKPVVASTSTATKRVEEVKRERYQSGSHHHKGSRSRGPRSAQQHAHQPKDESHTHAQPQQQRPSAKTTEKTVAKVAEKSTATEKPIERSDERPTGTQQQHQRGGRTRRGTRGGRRRGGAGGHRNPANKPNIAPTEIPEIPDDLLPPFPDNLEDYAKESSVPRGSRTVMDYDSRKQKSSEPQKSESQKFETKDAVKEVIKVEAKEEIKKVEEFKKPAQAEETKSQAKTEIKAEAKPISVSKPENSQKPTSETREAKKQTAEPTKPKEEAKPAAPQSAAPFAQPFRPIPNVPARPRTEEANGPVIVRADDANKNKPKDEKPATEKTQEDDKK